MAEGVAETRELGTLFTADVSDFLAKTKQVRSEVAKFYADQAKLTSGTQSLAKQQRDLSGAIDSVSGSSRKAVSAVGNLLVAQREHGKQLQRIKGGWEQVKGAMRVTASYGVASAAIFGVVNALRTGVKEIAEFDQALKNLQAVTGATDAQVAEASTIARKIATETKFSATEVSQGLVLLGQAGLTASESISAIGAVSTLATGTLETFDKTADMLTSTLVSFNMKATESGRVADVMANAINRSKLTVEKLRVVFGYVGASAHQAGLTLEQLAAATMVLANNGLRASTTATGLRQVLARLLSPGTKLSEAFQEINLSADKVNPSIVGFEDAIRNLAPVLTDNRTGMIDMARAYEFFGLRGAQAAAILVDSFRGGNFREALETLYEVGAAEAMAAKQKEGLAIQAKNLADRMRNLAISLGDAGILGALKRLVGGLSAAIDAIDIFVRSVGGQAVTQMILWTSVIGGTTFAIGKLVAAFKTMYAVNIIPWINGLTTAYKALAWQTTATTATATVFMNVLSAHPFVVMTIAVSTLIVSMKMFGEATDRNIKRQEGLVESYSKASGTMSEYINRLEELTSRMGQGEDVGKEYESLLERLKADHPELARQVDLNKDSYYELLNIFREFLDLNISREIDAQTRALGFQYQKIIQMKNNLENEDLFGFAAMVPTDQSEIDKELNKFDKYVTALARKIYDSFEDKQDVHGMKLAAQTMVESLKVDPSSVLSPDEWDNVFNKVVSNFEVFAKKAKDNAGLVAADIKKIAAGMDADFKKVFEGLGFGDKAEFAFSTKKLDSQISALKKRWSDMGAPPEEIDAEIAEMKKRFLEQFQNSVDSKADLLQLEKQFQSKMASLETNDFARIQQKEQAELEDAKVWYEKRKAAAIEHGEETSSIDAQYEKLVTQVHANAARERLNLDQDMGRRRIDIQAQQAEILLEKERQAAAQAGGDEETMERIRARQLQAAVQHSKAVIAVEEQSLARAKSLYGEGSREALDALSQLLSARKNYERDVTALETHNAKERIKQARDEGMAKLNAAKKFSDEWISVLEELHDKGIINEEKYAAERRRLQDHLDREEIDRLKARLKTVAKYSEEWLAILENIYAKEGLTAEQYTQKVNQAYKEMFDNIEKQWRRGIVSSEEYTAAVEEALRREVVSEEEANEKRIAANGTMWQQISYGFQKGKGESQAWGEFLISTSEKIGPVMADNLTSGLFDFIDGTKTASEAMRDFAKDTLNWLAKLILRWQMLQIITSLMGFSKSTPGAGAPQISFSPELSDWRAPGMHGGGIVGKDHSFIRRVDPAIFAVAPRLHTGLRPDEFPAILQRGEQVLSRREVAAGRGAPVLNITVNNTAPGTRARVEDSGNGIDYSIIVEQIESDIARRAQRGSGIGPWLDTRYRKNI